MNEAHRWAKEIAHFVNGGEVEGRLRDDDDWFLVDHLSEFQLDQEWQFRVALEKAWADTNPDNFEDTQPMDFNAPIDPGYMDDFYTDVVRLVTFVLLFAICYMVFG